MLNALKYQYTNGMVEGKNNKIKVIKRISFGYSNFRNFRLRILLMEKYKGSIHNTSFVMDAAA
ncbi:transposase [Peptostreptococcus canis]|uniref:transposase n=1 Tax=Peptostreptococcus canis TaxID=1159213 RepID=UPI003071BFE8|nr:transposase [Peptostreptococcus canis]